jgi:dinuclear metal center YbgI/SA1388 family protein
MKSIVEIASMLETWAHISLQENYDNCGLLVGDGNHICKGIMITLDCTEKVVEEAIETGCNMIIAHHPIIFKGLKKINPSSDAERAIIKAIQHNISIYAIHTNLDNVKHGVNAKIAQKLGLINTQILRAVPNNLSKLITFVPSSHHQQVLSALHQSGAGHIGAYSHCSFNTEGIGTFKASANANPFIGEIEKIAQVSEVKVEVVFPVHLQSAVLKHLLSAHPYEMPAFDIIQLNQSYGEIGGGMIGDCPVELSEESFLELLKRSMNTRVVRTSPLLGKKIRKVALCGGSGSFMIGDAKKSKADVYVTSDVKYHEFFEADNKILIADINHHDAEYFTKELIFEYLSEKIANIAILLSKVNTNPISYF